MHLFYFFFFVNVLSTLKSNSTHPPLFLYIINHYHSKIRGHELISLENRLAVPPKYPMDMEMVELIKLSVVDQVQRLGLAEHFNEEIDRILKQIYE